MPGGANGTAFGAALVVAALALAPTSARAQLADELASPGWIGQPSIVLDDGLGDDVRWEPSYVGLDYLPAGSPLAAVTARIGGIASDDRDATSGPSAEIAVMMDIRFGSSLWHLRFGAVLGVRWAETREVFGRVTEQATTAPLSGSVRLQPIAFDVLNVLSVRIGGDMGLQWVPSAGGGHLEWMPEGSAEVVLRDAARGLEVGLYGGIRGTAVANGLFSYTSMRPQVIFGLSAGAFLP